MRYQPHRETETGAYDELMDHQQQAFHGKYRDVGRQLYPRRDDSGNHSGERDLDRLRNAAILQYRCGNE
jgi:hypothetical protein